MFSYNSITKLWLKFGWNIEFQINVIAIRSYRFCIFDHNLTSKKIAFKQNFPFDFLTVEFDQIGFKPQALFVGILLNMIK